MYTQPDFSSCIGPFRVKPSYEFMFCDIFFQDLVPGWNGITVPLDECAVAGCRNNDVRIIGAPVLCFFLFLGPNSIEKKFRFSFLA